MTEPTLLASAQGCLCAMGSIEGVRTFSREWYVAHRDHHVALFPESDSITRRNLDDLVRWAK